MTRTQRSAGATWAPPAAWPRPVTTRAKREGRQVARDLPPPFVRVRTRELGDSAHVAIETRTKKGAAPRAAPRMRGCSNRQYPRPGRGRSRPMSAPAQCRLTPGFLGDSAVAGPGGFPFSLVPVVPIDAEVCRWETRSTQACGFEGKARLGGHSRARRSPYPPPRPSSFAGLVDRWVVSRRSREHGAVTRTPVLPGTAAVESLSGRRTPPRRPRKPAG
jgi:hypothetical protein